MGIFNALNTSVGGLQAQSYALQNISGNIANAQTTGFKSIGTSFVDLLGDASSANRQVAGGVSAYSQQTVTTQGTIAASTVATNIAINGDGFFSVQKQTGKTDNQPTFSGVTNYTRRGDFQINSNGNLVNGAGYFLMGVPVDSKTGNPLGNVPQVLQFQNNFVPAQKTAAITYAANLPTTPTTVAKATATAGTIAAYGGLNTGDFIANPTVAGTLPPPYGDVSRPGSQQNSNAGTGINGTTTLSGTAGTNSLSSNFAPNNTVTINGTVLTFVASGATGNQLNVTDNVSDLLAKIDAVTGTTTPSTVSGGIVTLHTGLTSNISLTSNNTAAFGSLGFPVTVTATRSGGGTTGTGTVIANDVDVFQKQSISGGAVTGYDATGAPVQMQLRWAKTDTSALGAGHADTWNLFYQSNPNATGAGVAWTNAGTNFTFDSAGKLINPATASITLSNVSVGTASLGNVALNVGSGGLTQYSSTSGTATINTISQNGYAAGQLQSIAVNDSGLVVGTFTNGQNINLASVTLSHFNGTNYLKTLEGGAYAATELSGVAIIGGSGTITGSSLEGSNADIADEFTKLIVTQQAYSANTKVITTANSMVQDLLNVLR